MALLNIKKVKKTKETVKEVASDEESENTHEMSASETEENNAGWADSIAKVLNTKKPKTKKTLVLSRAKKFKKENNEESKKVSYDFEVAKGEGTKNEFILKEIKPDKKELDDELSKPKNLILSLRVKPSWRDMERERTFRKVATRGVVQLFNAVRVQQKDLEAQLEQAGPLDSRRDAVLNNIDKKKFLDVLMSGDRAKSEAIDGKVKPEKSDSSSDDEAGETQKKKKKWSVLEADFMTGKKAKNWEDDEEDEEAMNDNDEAESSDVDASDDNDDE